MSITRQIDGNGSVEIPNTSFHRPFEEDPNFVMKNLVLKKKTKEKKEILGFICRKYIFESKSKVFTLEAWVTECFPYDKMMQTKKYFGNIFTENGLILEQTRHWDVATQTMRAEKIIFQPCLPEDIRALLLR